MSGDVDVHVPNTTGTRVVAGVLTSVVAGAIVGTFAILWTMNEKLTTVNTQQGSIDRSIEQNLTLIRADISAIKSRLRDLERENGGD